MISQQKKKCVFSYIDSSAVTSQPPCVSLDGKMDPDVKMDLEYVLEKNLKQIITK